MIKYSEWQSASGIWYCGNIADVAGDSNKWWYPARLIGLPIDEYVKQLVEIHKAIIFGFDGKTLIYGWKNYADVHKFVLYINRIFKNKFN